MSGAIALWVIVRFWRPLIATTPVVLAALFLYRHDRAISFTKLRPTMFCPSSDH